MSTHGSSWGRRLARRLGPITIGLVAITLVVVPELRAALAPRAIVTFRLDPRLLTSLGLEMSGLSRAVETGPAGPRFGGSITGDPRTGVCTVTLDGGFAWRAFDPVSGTPRPPLLLYGTTIEVNTQGEPVAIVRTPDPSVPVCLEVRNTSLRIGPSGQADLSLGDLHVTEEWARRLNDPRLGGRWVGSLDVRFALEPDGIAPAPAAVPEKVAGLAPDPPERGFLDVSLAELWSLAALGHVGTYPTGTAGLSAATTSCNLGEVDVPWQGPMFQHHPFIGLALFRRDAAGTLEMIGKNWIKHGFEAQSDNACAPCVNPSNGNYLAVGCSDTYSTFNNGWTYYLGPREEINPYTARWDSCGSYFDGTPADCLRDYIGELDPVLHRLEVPDADLDTPGAAYFYEGIYLVSGDDDITNNIAWRECTATWTGSSWTFETVDVNPLDEREPHPGPLVLTWGDVQDVQAVAPNDGQVMLATRVTDVGDGTWHYEYALYNRNSQRAIRAFSVPVGASGISNIGFHDIDQDGTNDWTATQSNGVVTWQTDELATDPDAPALTYQTLFNFRFDSDRSPTTASATAEMFRPGIGSSVLLSARGPDGTPSGSSPIAEAGHVVLHSGFPNPFRAATTIEFSLARPQGVRLRVLDVTGRAIRVLLDGEAPAGTSAVRWLGRDESGSRVAAGVYFYRLETPAGARTVRGILLK